MAPLLLENESNSTSFTFQEMQWPEQSAYRCHVCLVHEEDGQVSAIVLNLPGAGSCGMTEEEALANVEEAVRGVIESYEKDESPVPWQDSGTTGIPEGAKLRWILVDAQ
jgi:predicted RNase H-like HicB family nuclease